MYIIILLSFCIYINADVINTIVKWKRLQFDYATEALRQADIQAKIFDPDVPAAVDVDVYYNPVTYQRLLFVTIPRFIPGVPVTFGIVTNKLYENDPVIQPFPSWEWHRDTARCKKNRLVSVFRVKIDRCGLLWILDSGNEGNGIICKPQLLAFDLKKWPNEKLPLFWYEYPDAAYKNDSLFVTPIIESIGRECQDGAYAYVADTNRRSIVFSNLNNLWSQSFNDISMTPEQQFSTFNIAGSSFFLDDGVLGMDLSPNGNVLYYSALSGSYQSKLSTYNLKNNQPPLSKPAIQTFRTPRRTQSAALAINEDGIALFGLLSDLSIACWNTNYNDYGNYIKTVYVNKETMQFPSGIKIVRNLYGVEEFWVLTSRLQKFMTTGYNFTEVNFRISMGNVDDLVHPCY